ncbi:MAG: hypothetical protein KA368_05975 [Acidobacteria bacterium]|nr:hypothetical protein [Acidobacteriota bacterium]
MRISYPLNVKVVWLAVTATLLIGLAGGLMKSVVVAHQSLPPRFRSSLSNNEVLSIEPTPVTIAPDKSKYNQREVITAVITNNLETPIVSFDMKSYCTMVYLQKLEKDQWINTASCPLRRAPFPTTIRFGDKIKVALAPSTNTPGPNAAGIYRLNFPFRIGTLEGKELVVTSQTFRIDSADGREKVSFLPKQYSSFTYMREKDFRGRLLPKTQPQ